MLPLSAVYSKKWRLEGKECLASLAFTEDKKEENSTFRELKAFHETWTNISNLEIYHGQRISHHVDNQGMVHIIIKGSCNRKLRDYNIYIIVEPVWVDRNNKMIKYADLGSRDFHADDITIDWESFNVIQEKIGNFTVDCFASSGNAIC